MLKGGVEEVMMAGGWAGGGGGVEVRLIKKMEGGGVDASTRMCTCFGDMRSHSYARGE